MTYAYLTDGLDPDKRSELDAALEGGDDKAKARKERAAVEAALRSAH